MSHAASRSTRGNTPASPRAYVSAYTSSAGEPEHDAQASAGVEARMPLRSPEERCVTHVYG
jgi:hypothetical protein